MSKAKQDEIEHSEIANDGDLINEIVPVKTVNTLAEFNGIASVAFDDKQISKLTAKIDHEIIEIDPQGLIYAPQVQYRRRLGDAFGVGAWAIRPINQKIDEEASRLYYEGELWVEGRYIANAVGEQRYIKSNDRMSWATCVEAAKSDCITRCCKDLGIFSELWDKRFIHKWKSKMALQIMCKHAFKKKEGTDKPLYEPRWRRHDDPQFEYPWEEFKNLTEPGQPIDHIADEVEADKKKYQHALSEGDKLEMQLKASIKKEQGSKEDLNKMSKLKSEEEFKYYQWLKRMTNGKEHLFKLSNGNNKNYYDLLGRHGFEHSNQVKKHDIEIMQAIMDELIQVWEDLK